MWLFAKDRLPWARGKVVGLAFEQELRFGDVGVSDNLVHRLGSLGRRRLKILVRVWIAKRHRHTESDTGGSFRLTRPVYSSKAVSAFSRVESTTSTTPLQFISISSTSSSLGALTLQAFPDDCSNRVASSRSRAVLSSSCWPTSGLTVRWKPRSSAAMRLTVLTVEIRDFWTLSCSDLKS